MDSSLNWILGDQMILLPHPKLTSDDSINDLTLDQVPEQSWTAKYELLQVIISSYCDCSGSH